VERFERVKAFGDPQRHVIRQHDAPRADANALGSGCHVLDQNLGGGARDARHAMMLGQPIPGVSQPIGEAGEIDRVAERLRRRGARADGSEIEDGKGEGHVNQQYEADGRSRDQELGVRSQGSGMERRRGFAAGASSDEQTAALCAAVCSFLP
jgi:hypothetical protein